jgi:hypothetical protein
MLLVAYAKEQGAQYLIQTLTQALNNIFSLLDKCEVDAQKLNSPNPEELILLGKQNLQQVCEKLFEVVFVSRPKIPEPILEMCRFLAFATDEVEGDVSSDLPMSSTLATRASNAKPRILGRLKEKENSIGPASAVAKSGTNLFVVQAESVPLPSVMMEKHHDIIPRSIRTSVYINPPTSAKSKSGEQLQPSRESMVSSHSVAMSVMNSQDKSKTLGNLSTAEKIIGSFLFLRFIVPGYKDKVLL